MGPVQSEATQKKMLLKSGTGGLIMAGDDKKMTCAPNYEAYYEEYRDKYNCMCEKVHNIEEKLKEEHERNMILEAQMEVVRLVFGGNGND